MFLRKFYSYCLLVMALTLPCGWVWPQQKITDFYLSNVRENGSRDWEVKGDEAYIYDEHVDIDQMKANYYTPEDTIVVTSDKARLNKTNMDVHLEDNVRVVNNEGASLATESLDWYQQNNRIETDDWVTTSKDKMQLKAKGLSADTQF